MVLLPPVSLRPLMSSAQIMRRAAAGWHCRNESPALQRFRLLRGGPVELGRSVGRRSEVLESSWTVTKIVRAPLRVCLPHCPVEHASPGKSRLHRTAIMEEQQMRFAYRRSPAILAGIRLLATLAGCACRPGYVGPYGGLRPARCWVW